MKRTKTRTPRAKKMTPEIWDKAKSEVDRFNKRHPIGSEVSFSNDFGKTRSVRVKYKASLLSSGVPVMWLEGIPGCYLLSRVID